jgi:predicted ATPase/DNA-binding SARP family transcriptional activator
MHAEAVGCCVLGPIAVRAPDGSFIALRGQSAALLAGLVAAYPHGRRADQLAELIWPVTPPPSAAIGLRRAVHDLRTALARAGLNDAVQFAGAAYRLAVEPSVIDSAAFDAALHDARQALVVDDARRALGVTRSALALWRGRAFGALADGEALRVEAARLELARLDAEELEVEAQLAVGDQAGAAERARALASAEPLRELRWALLMVALYRSGRQAEALRAGREARAVLAGELGVEPGPDLRAIEQAVLFHDRRLDAGSPRDVLIPPAVDAFVAALHDITWRDVPSAPTDLVGRTAELARITAALTESRLVTIVGPGGAGKTRLALAVAHGWRRSGPDDVVFAALDRVDGASLSTAIAEQVQVQVTPSDDVTATICARLRGSRGLIVLDNCEHVATEAASLVSALLRSCPELRVLATSRRPLDVDGEAQVTLGSMAADDGIALLRRRAADVGVVVGDPPTDQMVRVLEQLEGLPLGIELAAAQLDTMTWDELEHAVSAAPARLRVAGRAEPRQRDLEAVVAWSYSLLADESAAMLSQLSVMNGWFTAAAAAEVAGVDASAAASLLRDLTRWSLVVADRTATTSRLRLVEAVRAYAATHVDDAWAARKRHRRHYADLVQRLLVEWNGPDERTAAGALDDALDNVRAAFRSAIESGSLDEAADLAVAMWRPALAGLHWDVVVWPAVVLDQHGARELANADAVIALAALGRWFAADYDSAARLANEAIVSAEQRGRDVPWAANEARLLLAGRRHDLDAAADLLQWFDDRADVVDTASLVSVKVVACIGATFAGLSDDAARLAREATELAASTGNHLCEAYAAYADGLRRVETDEAGAIAQFDRGAALARSVGGVWVLAQNMTALATVMRRSDRFVEALAMLHELLPLWHRSRMPGQLRPALYESARCLAAVGDREGARLAFQLAEAVDVGLRVLSSDRPGLESLRVDLGQPPGRPLTDDAIAEVTRRLARPD